MATYKVVLPKVVHYITDPDPRVRWCKEQFREDLWDHTGWSPITFHFCYEADAVLFALKWSGREN